MAAVLLLKELITLFGDRNECKSMDSDMRRKEISFAFSARLMALYRSQENKLSNPLIQDPFADHLVGDMTEYLSQHPLDRKKLEYPIIRSYYIEQTLIKRFKNNNKKLESIQIVSFGAGLDTKPYRLQYLTEKDYFFEIDVDIIHKYKSKILDKKLNAKPLCKLKYITQNLENNAFDTMQLLICNGFNKTKPTFWLFEGVVMYINIESVKSILNMISNYSVIGHNEIFVDIGNSKFHSRFKWGLTLNDVSSFFAKNGNWNVIQCNYCGQFDQNRNIMPEQCIFFNGTKIDKTQCNKFKD